MASGDDYIEPAFDCSDDKKDPQHYVRIGVDIKGLKKKLIGKEASNAEVSLSFENERSFELIVQLEKGKGKTEKYKLAIKKLPDEISTDLKKSYWKVMRNEEVTVMLHKVKPASWAGPLSRVGLEHDGQ